MVEHSSTNPKVHVPFQAPFHARVRYHRHVSCILLLECLHGCGCIYDLCPLRTKRPTRVDFFMSEKTVLSVCNSKIDLRPVLKN